MRRGEQCSSDNYCFKSSFYSLRAALYVLLTECSKSPVSYGSNTGAQCAPLQFGYSAFICVGANSVRPTIIVSNPVFTVSEPHIMYGSVFLYLPIAPFPYFLRKSVIVRVTGRFIVHVLSLQLAHLSA